MIKHKIAYIDEEEDAIIRFQQKTHEVFDVLPFFPKPDLNAFVDELLNSGAKAFVADFRLNEYRTSVTEQITYTGAELIESILAIRKGYPCIVLTAYDEDATRRMNDVNYVYPKNILNKPPGRVTLPEKLRIQIEHYQANIENKNRRFYELLEKSETQALSEAEENELLKLDSFLESALNNRKSLSPEKKSRLALGKVEELLNSTNELLKALKGEAN